MPFGQRGKCQLVAEDHRFDSEPSWMADLEGDVDSDDGSEWRPYSSRPEWADVVPVPQNDGPNPVVSILYSDKFRDVYDYFRAVLLSEEKSLRAFELTKDALELNSANYTVWQFRREILEELNLDLYKEMEYIQQVIDANPKNYQVWHHRRVIVERMKDPSMELELTASVLQQDPKNYHAWQHRQWVIKTYKLFDDELDYVESLLMEDVRNNSAWNQRYFVITNTTGFTDEVIEREVSYTINKIKFIKTNESSWNFLRGVLLHYKPGMSGHPVVTSFCEDLYNASNRTPYLLAMIIDMCTEVIGKGEESPLYNAERGLQLCRDMADKYDKIRAKYWMYIAKKFTDGDKSDEQSGDATGATTADSSSSSESSKHEKN